MNCTGKRCIMQFDKVDPATCQCVSYCPQATPPKTNADRIRTMSDEELAEMFLTHDEQLYRHCPSDTFAEYCQVKPCVECCDCKACWLDWLKQKAEDEE